MKVLLIGHEIMINGASRSLLDLADQLLGRGYIIYVLTAYNKGPFIEALNKRNVKVIVKPYYRWCEVKGSVMGWVKKYVKWHFLFRYINKHTAKELARFCKDEEIDIIHSNTSVINIGGLISQYSGIKHIWHIREFADLDFNMYPLIPKKSYYEFMNRNADRFIFVSKAVAGHYRMLADDKKQVIYNGVRKVDVLRETESKNGEIVRLLIAGMLNPAKGQDEAVRACLLLIHRGIKNFELILAGAGKKYFEIPDEVISHIKMIGFVEDIYKIRRETDIELMCSRAEAFGRVTAEAMMSGIPVIGANTGGTPELIQDGVTGFIYEKGNTEQLADRLAVLILDESKRKKMGDSARKYAIEHFGIKRCADEIETTYKTLA